ncbi:MAG: hypothetical protein RPR28_02680 [Cycloclasticus sp.]
MKRFCLMLVFVNVVYFFWGLNSQQTEISEADKFSAEVAGLQQLNLREVEEPVFVAKPEEPVVHEVVVSLPVVEEVIIESCFQVDGFASEKEAARLLSAMQARQLTASLSRRLVAEEFWLVLPVANSWQQSLQDVKNLKAKGVSDLWLVPSGIDKGVISLGLFAEKSRAERRLKQLQAQKIKAVMRLKQRFVYAVSLKSEAGLASVRSLLSEFRLGKVKSINKISC